MRKRMFFPILSWLFLSILASGQEWWQKKPSPEWTPEEVDRMLCASPWVGLSAAQGIRRTVMVPLTWVNVDMGRMGNTSSFPQGLSVPAYYCVRLLTAKPVRDAFLREISLAPEATISVDDLKSGEEAKSRRMTRAAAIRARDFLNVGDDQHIILAITLRIADPGRWPIRPWRQTPPP